MLSLQGMIFIHESPLQFHGALRPSNCLVDARWVVKLADFGLKEFRKGEMPPTEPNALRSHIESKLFKVISLFCYFLTTPTGFNRI